MSRITLFLFTLLLTFNAVAQDLKLTDKLPLDPKIKIGTLKNGIKYYIRENRKPENRAEIRLAVNVGSVLEDDDQRGLAHFVEHMAFNGTKNFAKHEIIDYLESIGMRFGPDINAYTSFDETVYMLQVPTDDDEIVDMGFQILEEWAHNIAFEDEEIDKERGVVIEEWRLGRGASARMRDKQFPILFHDSRYADRLPIGKKEIIENASYETVRRFYSDWYRPDLMAVVAVGDFDQAEIEDLIEKYFSNIKPVKNPRERKFYAVPNHAETLFAPATDIEATGSNITVYFKQDVADESTVKAYRQSLVESLYDNILNNRLSELLQQAEPPFLSGFSGQGRFIRTKEFYVLGAAVQEGNLETGIEAVLTEAWRIKQHGFTQSELDREKSEIMRGMERAYNERDKTESDGYAAEYIRNFLQDESLPGIEVEYKIYQKFIPGIKLEEVNRLADEWITDGNRVVTISAPEKEGLELPSEADINAIFKKMDTIKLDAYEDDVPDMPLVQNPPQPGKIISEKKISELGLTEWELANGVKVVLKPTDFKNDEILFTSYSPGGHSLVKDSDFVSAIVSASIIRQGGVGSFDRIALQKKLAGRLVRVSPFIGQLDEGLSGSATPQDIETAFELIYLYFTAPRKDNTAFLSFQNRMSSYIESQHASPEAAYGDTIQVTLSKHHFRTRPWSKEVLAEMDLDKCFNVYQNRFADASDFTFFFVGNFELAEMRPLVEKYLGGLPDKNREETWHDVGIEKPEGIVKKEVKKGIEPKSKVTMIFHGDFVWNRKNRHHLSSMVAAFQIKLREILREDLGGTYGVRIRPSSSRYPDSEYSITIAFGCDPERVDELRGTVMDEIDNLKIRGLTKEYLDKVKESQRRKRETDLKKNNFWLSALQLAYYHDKDPRDILEFEKQVDSLTLGDIKSAARKYFNTRNYVQVVLLPEGS